MKKIISALGVATLATLAVVGSASASNQQITGNEDSSIVALVATLSSFSRTTGILVGNSNNSSTANVIALSATSGNNSIVADDGIADSSINSGDNGVAGSTSAATATETNVEVTPADCGCETPWDDQVVSENEDTEIGVQASHEKHVADDAVVAVENSQSATDTTIAAGATDSGNNTVLSLTDGVTGTHVTSGVNIAAFQGLFSNALITNIKR